MPNVSPHRGRGPAYHSEIQSLPSSECVCPGYGALSFSCPQGTLFPVDEEPFWRRYYDRTALAQVRRDSRRRVADEFHEGADQPAATGLSQAGIKACNA